MEGPFFVRIKLRDGERVGGWFGRGSFATAYPEAQDIFLEETWRLTENGEFVEPMEGTAGMLVPEASIELVELLLAEEAS